MCNIIGMKNSLSAYNNDQKGAVTVDFVVITAGVVLIGAAAGTALTSKVTAAVAAISL